MRLAVAQFLFGVRTVDMEGTVLSALDEQLLDYLFGAVLGLRLLLLQEVFEHW